MIYDVSIVGAGIIGSAIARELAKYQLQICLLDKNDDVGSGTTKANSGIIHGGYADQPGTARAKFCPAGNAMYHKLQQDLHFGLAQTGSFVIGFDEHDRIVLEGLLACGEANNIPGLQLVDGAFVREREPYLNPAIKCALFCPTAGVVAPYEVAIAFAENAVQNGTDLRLNTTVLEIKKEHKHFVLNTNQGEIFSRRIINAAGLYADEIAKMVGICEINIQPRAGQYLLFDKDMGESVKSVVFQVPTPVSKGVLVARTYHGNLLLGPDAAVVPEKDYLDTTTQNIETIIATAKKTLPQFDLRKVITCFAGNRAATNNHDFIIGKTPVAGFINAVGIESPGLTAAPAIAKHVAEIVVSDCQPAPRSKTDFDPCRKPYIAIANMNENELHGLIKRDPEYGCVVCRCEEVSLGEIRASMHREIPVSSLDAIKRRTRAGMGRCQGGFCTPKIIDIISQELKIPLKKVTKKGGGSYLVAGLVKQTNEDD